MTARYYADTDALRLGRPNDEPLASETMGPIVDYIEALIERGHAYESDGRRLLPRALRPRLRLAVPPPPGRHGPGRGRGGRRSASSDPLDFALWKAHKEGEDTFWAVALGSGRPGWHIECSAMAEHSLLGVGFDIHGGGSDLLFPHHENEAAQTRAARGEELARIWMHNGMIQFTGEKMAKSVGNIAPLHEVVERYGRDAVVMYLVSGHYRQPLAFSEAALEQATRQRQVASARRRAGSAPGDSRQRHLDELARPLLRGARQRLQHARSALAHLNEWLREATRSAIETKGDADLREMLGVLGLGELAGRARSRRRPTCEALAERSVSRPGRSATSQAADRLREEIAALGWEVRDVAGRLRAAAAVILYGRNPCGRRCAAAARTPSVRCGRPRGAAREPWLGGGGGAHGHGRGDRAALRLGGPPGGLRGGRRLPVRLRRRAARRGPDPLIVALDQVQDPQNLGSICRTAECAGATGVVIPERRAAEVTPAVCKASAGAVEHLRVARVRNLADFLGEAQKAGCWSYGASAGAATPYDRPDYRGGVVLVLGSEGRGLRPRVAGACDRADRAAAAGADRVARGERGGGGAPVRDLAQSPPSP